MNNHSTQYYRDFVDEQTISELLQLMVEVQSLDDAWYHYGLAQGSSATGEDPEAAGKRTFVQRLHELRSIFCSNPSIRAVVQNPALDKEIDLATVLAGVLLHQNYPGAQIAAIAVLVAKIGVLRLCDPDYLP